jgi:hypothetical protein
LNRGTAGARPPTIVDRESGARLHCAMGGRLKNFLDFLASEKVIREAGRKRPTLRSFARAAVPADYAQRLARSYLIETRTAIVETGKAEIWSVGNIVRVNRSAAFKPARALAADVRKQSFRFGKEAEEFFGFKFEGPQSHSGTELLAAVANRLLEKDPGLERLQARRGADPMEAVWRTFGAAVHDQLCRHQPLELETIGIFSPVASAETVRFIADEHLLNLIAGRPTTAKQKLRTLRSVGPAPKAAVGAGLREGKFRFLDDERDFYPSDESPNEGLIRDLKKEAKDS